MSIVKILFSFCRVQLPVKILNLFAHVSLFSQFQFSRIFLITMETRKPKPHICDDLGLEETYCDSEEREIGRRAG